MKESFDKSELIKAIYGNSDVMTVYEDNIIGSRVNKETGVSSEGHSAKFEVGCGLDCFKLGYTQRTDQNGVVFRFAKSDPSEDTLDCVLIES